MISRRLLVLFAPLVLTINQPCGATTAASLADRVVIDGDVSEWADDEWVLDNVAPPSESPADSRWGPNDEILRVGVTWDAQFLYLALEFRGASSAALASLGYAPGGFASLDGAGTFRRAIDFPFAINLLALATARDAPTMARVDDRGVLVLVDRAQAPAVVRTAPDGTSALEVALPWATLSLARPLELALASTGVDEGTGAGDAAPDPSLALPATAGPSTQTRATLDRWLSIPADADADGTADAGVAPRAVVVVRPDDDGSAPRPSHVTASMSATPKVFAPDNGEETTLAVAVDGASTVFATARVYAVDGRLVRVLYEDAERTVSGGILVSTPEDRWDGRDADGRVVAGGVYVVAFEWGLVRGERAGRATAGVAVAR